MNRNTSIEKEPPGRSEAYLDYIRGQRCWVCLIAPSEPHHTQKAGTGMKGSDFSCVPLCTKHHREAHDMGRKRFQEQYHVKFAEAITHHLIHWADKHWGDEQ